MVGRGSCCNDRVNHDEYNVKDVKDDDGRETGPAPDAIFGR